jgi:hypothetical protein
VSFWIDGSEHNGPKVKSAIIRLTRRALRDAGVEIANPAQEVVLPGAPNQPPRWPMRRESEKGTDGKARETAAPVTPAEGRLASVDDQLQKQADQSRDAGSGTNLLSE